MIDLFSTRFFSSRLDLNKTSFFRRIRSSAYLLTLALIDAFFLLDLLPGMIHTALVPNLYRKMTLICYLQTYISFVASFLHIWMVLAFTAERFYAVNFPLKHMSQCTPNLSRGVIFLIIIPAFLCYIHPAFFISEVDQKGQCREKHGYERYLNNLNIIDTIMTMFLPFILVSVLNILIIRKLFCSKKFRQHVFANGSRYQCRRTSNWTSNSTTSQVSAPTTIPSATDNNRSPIISYRSQRFIRSFRPTHTRRPFAFYRTFINSDASHSQSGNEPMTGTKTTTTTTTTSTAIRTKAMPSARRHDSAHRHILTELRLTKMLLAISLTCLSLNFPSYYLRFMFFYKYSQENTSTPAVTTSSSNQTSTNVIDFAYYRDVIAHYMSYTSYAINIVIYLLFGGNFRRALKRLFSLTSTRSEHLNANLRGKLLANHEKIYGNSYECDSTVLSTTTPQSSLRGYPKLSKMREQSQGRRILHQQAILINEQNKIS